MRKSQRHIVRLMLLLVVIAPAAGDCPAPTLRQPAPVAAGEDLVVTGEHFGGCNDSGGGCSGARPSPPEQDISLEFNGDGKTVARTVVDAGEDFRLTARLPIPASTAPGTYVLFVTSAEAGSDPIAILDVEILPR